MNLKFHKIFRNADLPTVPSYKNKLNLIVTV